MWGGGAPAILSALCSLPLPLLSNYSGLMEISAAHNPYCVISGPMYLWILYCLLFPDYDAHVGIARF